MPGAITNTSPLLYLGRIGGLDWLREIFGTVWVPSAVIAGLDDRLARRTAHAAGLTTWGTLRILLEAKGQALIPEVAPFVERLAASGMWISPEIRRRILVLAGEDHGG